MGRKGVGEQMDEKFLGMVCHLVGIQNGEDWGCEGEGGEGVGVGGVGKTNPAGSLPRGCCVLGSKITKLAVTKLPKLVMIQLASGMRLLGTSSRHR